MQIVITANGLYFSGKAGDIRRFLARLGASRRPLAEYIRENLQ